MIYVDTSFFVALLGPQDPWASRPSLARISEALSKTR